MNEMINATTSLIPLLTMNSQNTLYLNFSILTFSLVAGTNHVLPENLDGLTHIVKYLFSNLLFSLVNLNPLYGYTIAFLDILPLLFTNKILKQITELLLQIPRQIIELYLIYLISFDNKIDTLIMIICKIIYFYERRERIKAGTRNDFPIAHSAEHYGIFLLLKNKTNSKPEIYEYLLLVIILKVFTAIFIYFYNKYIDTVYLERIPKWFENDQNLIEVLKDKIEKNKNSEKLYNYLTKPLLFHLKLQIVTWSDMEKYCNLVLEKINPNEIDVVCGIKTGGFFVGKYIASKLNKKFVFVNSKLWSGISMKKNLHQAYSHYVGDKFSPKISDVPILDIKNKRVLLCDDTSYTGSTMRSVVKMLKENAEPQDIKTLCIWIYGQFYPDYYERIMRVPILWEWGAEVD